MCEFHGCDDFTFSRNVDIELTTLFHGINCYLYALGIVSSRSGFCIVELYCVEHVPDFVKPSIFIPSMPQLY